MLSLYGIYLVIFAVLILLLFGTAIAIQNFLQTFRQKKLEKALKEKLFRPKSKKYDDVFAGGTMIYDGIGVPGPEGIKGPTGTTGYVHSRPAPPTPPPLERVRG